MKAFRIVCQPSRADGTQCLFNDYSVLKDDMVIEIGYLDSTDEATEEIRLSNNVNYKWENGKKYIPIYILQLGNQTKK